jgi:amidase
MTRCKKAGLVFMGRSSSPEFGLNPNTEPRLYGSCHNPWNLEYSPGGSSGGAAAAVSAGILPVAHATDGGGSIRIPAAQCGLFGLKPSCDARLSCAPAARPPRKLRIALMLKDHRGANLHPECLEAACPVDRPPQPSPASGAIDTRPREANTAQSCNMRWRALGREPNADDVEAVTWGVCQRGLKVSGVEYIEAIAAVHAAGRKMGTFLVSYDVILSTTLAGPPPKLGYFDQNGDVQTFSDRVTEYLSVTPLHNATGTPAMSVPLHWTADGLPVGVHFAGRYGEEATPGACR